MDADVAGQASKKVTHCLDFAVSFDEDVTVIPYCQTGVRSATVYSVLRWLGHPNPKNYDGSWYEWSRINDYPVAEVENPTTTPEETE